MKSFMIRFFVAMASFVSLLSASETTDSFMKEQLSIIEQINKYEIVKDINSVLSTVGLTGWLALKGDENSIKF